VDADSTHRVQTPLAGGTPIKNDGTRYHWKLSYDPGAKDGNGQIHFTIRSDSDKPQDFEDKPISIDVPAEFKKQGSSFDRFGIFCIGTGGAQVRAYLDDLTYTASEVATKPPQ
jgi:hypothetical protein